MRHRPERPVIRHESGPCRNLWGETFIFSAKRSRFAEPVRRAQTPEPPCPAVSPARQRRSAMRRTGMAAPWRPRRRPGAQKCLTSSDKGRYDWPNFEQGSPRPQANGLAFAAAARRAAPPRGLSRRHGTRSEADTGPMYMDRHQAGDSARSLIPRFQTLSLAALPGCPGSSDAGRSVSGAGRAASTARGAGKVRDGNGNPPTRVP